MKKIGILIPLFALLFLAGCTTSTPQITPQATGTVAPVQTITTEPVQAKITSTADLLAIVSQHTGADSCYTMISGSVYDLTSRIGKHPGGDKAILSTCGKDATGKFDKQHGMDPKKWEGLKVFELKL